MEVALNIWKKLKNKILSPPSHLLQESKSHKATLAADWRYLILLDVLIWAFLLPSVKHLAFIFGWGDPDWMNYVQAWAFDFGIWFFVRSISKRIVDNYRFDSALGRTSGRGRPSKAAQNKRKSDWPVLTMLWSCLLILVGISTSLNILYELWDKDFHFEERWVVLYARISGSAMLTIMVVFLSFVRALQEKSMIVNFNAFKQAEKEEAELAEKRKKQREYAQRHREKQKAKPRRKTTAKKRGRRK